MELLQKQIILIDNDDMNSYTSDIIVSLNFRKDLQFTVKIENQTIIVKTNHNTKYFYNNILFDKRSSETLLLIGDMTIDKIIIKKVNWKYRASLGSFFLAEQVFISPIPEENSVSTLGA